LLSSFLSLLLKNTHTHNTSQRERQTCVCVDGEESFNRTRAVEDNNFFVELGRTIGGSLKSEKVLLWDGCQVLHTKRKLRNFNFFFGTWAGGELDFSAQSYENEALQRHLSLSRPISQRLVTRPTPFFFNEGNSLSKLWEKFDSEIFSLFLRKMKTSQKAVQSTFLI
jgi:hypothetical protein